METLKLLKESVSFLWSKPQTKEDKVIKRYDIIIFICIVSMILYGLYFVANLETKINTNTENISNLNPNDSPIIYNAPDTTLYPFYPTNSIPSNEFFVGEIVGVKYFGVFGLVREKVLGSRGYTYIVRIENNEHDLPTEEFYNWELYRPSPNSIPISVLRH